MVIRSSNAKYYQADNFKTSNLSDFFSVIFLSDLLLLTMIDDKTLCVFCVLNVVKIVTIATQLIKSNFTLLFLLQEQTD